MNEDDPHLSALDQLIEQIQSACRHFELLSCNPLMIIHSDGRVETAQEDAPALREARRALDSLIARRRELMIPQGLRPGINPHMIAAPPRPRRKRLIWAGDLPCPHATRYSVPDTRDCEALL